jgi:hypothetical protein
MSGEHKPSAGSAWIWLILLNERHVPRMPREWVAYDDGAFRYGRTWLL